MKWKAELNKKTAKRLNKLPEKICLLTQLLITDIENNGFFPGKQWPNFGKLKSLKGNDKYHCHLIKGKPTYVACWEIVDKKQKLIEVYYVGTHENAPY